MTGQVPWQGQAKHKYDEVLHQEIVDQLDKLKAMSDGDAGGGGGAGAAGEGGGGGAAAPGSAPAASPPPTTDAAAAAAAAVAEIMKYLEGGEEDLVIEKTLSWVPHFLAFHLAKADDACRLDDPRITLPFCPLGNISRKLVDVFSPDAQETAVEEESEVVVGPISEFIRNTSISLTKFIQLLKMDPDKGQ